MHCFNLTAPYAVLTKLVALRLECVHYRLNWAEKGVHMCKPRSEILRTFFKEDDSDVYHEISANYSAQSQAETRRSDRDLKHVVHLPHIASSIMSSRYHGASDLYTFI